MVDKVIVAGQDGVTDFKLQQNQNNQNNKEIHYVKILIVFNLVVLDSVGIGAAPDANNFVNAGVPRWSF